MRYLFGKSIQDWVIRPPADTPPMASSDGASVNAVVLAAPFTVAIVSQTEGGPAETDFEDTLGNPLSSISTDGNGFLNPFYGPDEVKVLWFSFDDGTSWRQVVSSQAVSDAADYVPPLVVIPPADTAPPPGTPIGTLVFRETF